MSTAVNVKDYTKRIGSNDYIMVSGRVLLAHEDNPEALSIRTELIQDNEDYVTMKATATTRKGEFDGHATSYKRTGSNFEKKTPLEVAETSAVGRALGLAGYAIENGIASADEMHKADDYGNGEPAAATAPRSNVRAMPQREAPHEAEQADADPRPRLAHMIGVHLRSLGLDDEQNKKLVRGLGPLDKEPRSYPVATWEKIWDLIRHTQTKDEALGLAVKAAKAHSVDTEADLFEPEELAPEPQRSQREEDAENAKQYTNTKPLVGASTEPQRKACFAIGRANGLTPEQVKAKAKEMFAIEHFDDLTKAQASALIESLKGE